jgi:alkylated DNA repair dioxygenase AlkB
MCASWTRPTSRAGTGRKAFALVDNEPFNNKAADFVFTQLAMFAEAPSWPVGLQYQADLISELDERTLVAQISALPLTPFQFGVHEGKRRVVFFGSRYDFTHQRLEEAEDFPAWILPIAARVERFAALPSGSIAHALCTEYDVGAGIGWHRDKKQFDLVFGLSLGSACKFRFRRKTGTTWERFTLDAQPRSLYVMTGESRHVWEHSIPPVETKRYSITFRTMAGAG